MTLLVNFAGITLICLVFWFFFMKKESEAISVEDEVNITVAGGYRPNVIRVKKGKPTTLKFYRKDGSSCLEEIVIPDFNIREHLALNKTTDIVINPTEAGEYEISCGMNMFHGKLIVE